MEEGYLTIREAARRLGKHENTIRNWIKSGRIQAKKLPNSGYRRIPGTEVERIEAERRDERRKGAASGSVHPSGSVLSGEHLHRWSGRRAQEFLPKLMQKLLGNERYLIKVRVRADEGIGTRGWDAEVESPKGMPWVPKGSSRWEFGTNENPSSKANDDYRTRTENPQGVDPAKATFVFVTSRRWPGAAEWEQKKREEGVWADVRVIDADGLIQWLETHPEVHSWASDQLGLEPLDTRSIEAWWSAFARTTSPPLSHDLMLAGRESEFQELIERLRGGDAKLIRVGATSIEEAVGFVSATLLRERAPEVSQALVVTSSKALRQVSESETPLTLIVGFPGASDLAATLSSGHNVVLPTLRGDEQPADVSLPRLSRYEANDALTAMGVDHQKTYRLSSLACRSVPALLRHPDLAVASSSRPAWVEEERSYALARLMLLGAWRPADMDQTSVAEYLPESWENLERWLSRLKLTADAPFIEAGGDWRLTSPEAAWTVLEHLLRDRDLGAFRKLAVAVLTEKDPALDLPLEEQHMAQLKNLSLTYSGVLRRGIAQGLALAGAYGSGNASGPGVDACGFAEVVVREILDVANKDASGAVWSSLSSLLSLLAEAAPETFLSAVEEGSSGDEPVIRKMFTDSDPDFSAMFASSPHTGLLWALESVAWSREHAERAVLALARLVQLDDPTGQLGNRPASSIRTILVSWAPQTSAPVEDRVAILGKLASRYGDVAPKILHSLVPRSGETSGVNTGSRFRQWTPRKQSRPSLEVQMAFLAGVTDELLAINGTDLGRWATSVDRALRLAGPLRERTIDELEGLDPASGSTDERLRLSNALRDFCGRHRSFPDANWSIEGTSLERLERVARAIEPGEAVERFARLFDHRPEIGANEEFETWSQRVEKLQTDAIKEVIEASGFQGIVRLASASVLPSQVGQRTADVAEDSFRSEMLGLFAGDDDSGGKLAAGWLHRRAVAADSGWSRDVLDEDLDQGQRVRVLQSLPLVDQTFDLVEEQAADISKAYWQEGAFRYVEGFLADRVAERLLEHGRPWAALDTLYLHCNGDKEPKPDPKLVVRALQEALNCGPDPVAPNPSISYEIGVLLDYLESSGASTETLVQLEWAYFPVLEDSRRWPTALYRALADEPSLFVELVCRVYKAKGEEKKKEPATDREAALATHSWRVLNEWREVPGGDGDGNIDGDKLTDWVKDARKKLRENDRLDIGDEQIGELLSGSPKGSDGVWPHESVRAVLEEVLSDHVETGLRIGKANARGITSRGPWEGGDQERVLADEYKQAAQKVRSEWGRAARVLDELAESYAYQARWEDERADRDAAGD